MPAIGGEYFFLHDRHRAHRPAGHERGDALDCFTRLGGSAFVKPLTGSRGDFAQAVHGEAALVRYLDDVAKYYDAVLIQPIVEGTEYRVFLLDDDVLYCARKYPPFVAATACAPCANCSPPITTPCAPAACRRLRCRIAIRRSTPYRRRANGAIFRAG